MVDVEIWRARVNTGFQRTLHLFLVLHGVRDADLFDPPKVENIGVVPQRESHRIPQRIFQLYNQQGIVLLKSKEDAREESIGMREEHEEKREHKCRINFFN